MSKENEIELMSYTDNGQRWLQCKSCYEYKKVDEDVKAVTCSRCTMIGTLKRKPMDEFFACLLYTSPSPRDRQKSRMPSSA